MQNRKQNPQCHASLMVVSLSNILLNVEALLLLIYQLKQSCITNLELVIIYQHKEGWCSRMILPCTSAIANTSFIPEMNNHDMLYTLNRLLSATCTQRIPTESRRMCSSCSHTTDRKSGLLKVTASQFLPPRSRGFSYWLLVAIMTFSPLLTHQNEDMEAHSDTHLNQHSKRSHSISPLHTQCHTTTYVNKLSHTFS